LNKIKDIITALEKKELSGFFYTPQYYHDSFSYFFFNPEIIITVSNRKELDSKLQEIDELKKTYSGFALINYEFGYLLEDRLEQYIKADNQTELLKFFFFKDDNVIKVNSRDLSFDEIDEYNFDDELIADFSLNIDKENYIKSVNKIRNYIREGDTYQVNYTVKGKFKIIQNPPLLFLQLLFNQSSRYTAYINDHDKIIMSFSPELFFRKEENNIITKPMKGTLRRRPVPYQDAQGIHELSSDLKNRAENIMIVDLLRNDLGKISLTGTVDTSEFYFIEKYETLFQMVTTVTAKLKNKNISDVIKSIFPSGSVTGAPKLRTMEIIKELEKEERGIYCGAVGLFFNDNLSFNVAIRTLVLNINKMEGEIGIGSGIVWDSIPEDEFDEVLLKGKFLTSPQKYFELFETMLIENGEVFLLNEHIKRLENAASYFLFIFHEKIIREKINNIINTTEKDKTYRLNIYLTKWGKLKFNLSILADIKNEFTVVLSNKIADKNNTALYFKTTDREFYNEAKSEYRDYDEVLLKNSDEEITEGTITNIFIKIDCKVFTPPINCGLLNGTYRQMLLSNDKSIEEKLIFKEDLLKCDEIFLTNSLRKIIKVKELYSSEGMLLRKFN